MISPIRVAFACAALISLACPGASAQKQTVSETVTINGVVRDTSSAPVSAAQVQLTGPGSSSHSTTTTSGGAFRFAALAPGHYQLTAQKSGQRSQPLSIDTAHLPAALSLTLVPSAQPAMQFSDQPSFAIAGVTDWTAVGGHGSDAILRTGESLARSTIALQPRDSASPLASIDPAQEARLRSALAAAPGSFQANHDLGDFYLRAGRYRASLPLLESAWRLNPSSNANTYDLALACRGVGDLRQARSHLSTLLARQQNPDWLRTAGDLDEQLGDPLAAVRDDQQAAALDPSEQNLFALGSELLLHRAIWQAQQVFRKGVAAWPHSVRMLSGLSAALFAGALYDQAAQSICAASDLAPHDPEPYLFMGKIDIASPSPLPCIQQKLARFARQQPTSASADYLYAMAILKAQERSSNPASTEQARSLLQQAVHNDPHHARAWFELGNLSAAKRNYSAAITLYQKAIDADPQLSDAYYRLGVAYDRTGNAALAQQQFRLHDQIAKQQTEAVNTQRRKIQQFLFAKDGNAALAP